MKNCCLIIAAGIALLLASCGTKQAGPDPFPAPAGPYAVGVKHGELADASRPELLTRDTSDRRKIMLQVFYPAQTPATCRMLEPPFPDSVRKKYDSFHYHHCVDAPPLRSDTAFPILIFSPGFGGSYLTNVTLAEELASHGYVVMYIGHPFFNDLPSFNNGKKTEAFSMDTLKMTDEGFGENFKNRLGLYFHMEAADILTLVKALQLNIILRDIPMDVKNLGLIGYSGGGAAAVLAAAMDPAHIKAVFDLDGILYGYGPGDTLNVPLFYFMSDLDYREPGYVNMNGGEKTYREIINYYRSQAGLALKNSQSDYYDIYVPKSLHTDFSDEAFLFITPGREGTIRNCHAEARQYALGFFDLYLKGDSTSIIRQNVNAGKEGDDAVLRKKR